MNAAPTPYTVHADFGRGDGQAVFDIDYNGKRDRSVLLATELATLLNDAYQAGIDEGRKLALKGLAPQAALSIAVAELNGDPSMLERMRQAVGQSPNSVLSWYALSPEDQATIEMTNNLPLERKRKAKWRYLSGGQPGWRGRWEAIES